MDFSLICRTCMSDNNLNPIFTNISDVDQYSSTIYMITGIKIETNDGLPQNMCTDCISFINKSKEFRNTCKEVEDKLLKLKVDKLDTHSADLDDDLFGETSLEDVCKGSENENNERKDEIILPLEKVEIKSEATIYTHTLDNQHLKCFQEMNEIPNVLSDDKKPLKGVKEDLTDLSGLVTFINEKRAICNLCNKELSKKGISTHVTRRHPGARRSCDVITPTKCQGRELKECDVCHKMMQKASLRLHKAVKHAGLGPVCEHCGRRFGNKYRLNEHYRAKHGYEKLKCSFCDFESSGVMAMRNHERRHRGEKPFVCDTCGAKFHAAYLLTQHKQSHRTQKLINCDLCPATFKARNSLHMHKLTCHSSFLYKCHLCSRVYNCRHYVVKHLRSVHHFKGAIPQLQKVPNDSTEDGRIGPKVANNSSDGRIVPKVTNASSDGRILGL